jgi:preprotein translocase SecE subunit
MAYKPEQGRITRTVAFWTLTLLLVYGCMSLNDTLGIQIPTLGTAFDDDKATLPILSWKLTPALLITLAVFGAGLFFLMRYLNRPKVADLLIETENELRKVTWPTFNEALNSSFVVIACVALLMAFLAGADWWLGWAVGRVLLGGG